VTKSPGFTGGRGRGSGGPWRSRSPHYREKVASSTADP